MGFVDLPGLRKIHSSPIPRIGGLALFISSFVGAIPFLVVEPHTAGVLLGATWIFFLGFLDDVYNLRPKVKLLGQLFGCLILFFFNVRIEFVTDFLAGKGLISLGFLTYPLTLFWVIGLTNTVNLIDGVDGLAGGIVFIALSTLLAVRLSTPHTQDVLVMHNVLILSGSLMGAILAFLRYNVFPATIFMGDSGAYFLGFITAALSIAGAAKGTILLPFVVPLLAFGLPVLDVVYAIVRRRRNGVNIFQADKEHFHHKLLKIGFSKADTTRFLWMVSSCFGLLAILTAGISH
ncbi:undecaprenyl/decaprenyl-phosphate alpha-N-acetylglucosaminyl 1-phosphate transferase, partial [bacterium]|nr:undecaprenyl/decaprenyl-phosphate alpha-N-acetylglucosaminyl 1-phosphate transferase [bacterium]